ncbi:hypothetical protein XENOCAPTIV_018329, partial [Xenoophorus captivus]
VSNNCQVVLDDGDETTNEPVRDTVPPCTRGSVAAEEVAAILNTQSSGGVSQVMGTGVGPNLLVDAHQFSALPQSQLVS